MLNSKFDLYKTEWLDLVFADRNKAYGAYDLRAHYGDNMLKALAITVLGFTVAAVSLSIAFKHDKVEDPVIVQIVPDIPIAPPKTEEPVEAVKRSETKKIDAPKPITAPQVNISTQRFVPPVVTSELVTTDPPVLDPTKQIGNVDYIADGTKPTTGILDGTTTPGNKGDAGTPTGIEDKTVYIGVDVMPEPNGGFAAFSKYLQKNLRYPDVEEQGRVIISFIIEKDGRTC
jgi:protein TonB